MTHDVPTVDVAALMDLHDIRNVPITDDDGKLVEIVGEHGLAQAYVRRLKMGELAIVPLPLDTLARIVSARVVVRAAGTLEGRVFIATDAPDIISKKLSNEDIVVAGDNEPMQRALIASGIAALIIAGRTPVSEQIRTEAQEHGVSVLATDLDAFGVGSMINLSLPARGHLDIKAGQVPQ